MKKAVIRSAVRLKFALTTRGQASSGIERIRDRYLALADSVDAESGRRSVHVPPMLGVDEDMRNWSFFMVLEHNAIVNRYISGVVAGLTRGKLPTRLEAVDAKRDVMPKEDAGQEQVEAFRISIEKHLEMVPALPRLRGGMIRRHPVFGDFDAHRWHCMFGLHLRIHLKQAEAVAANR